MYFVVWLISDSLENGNKTASQRRMSCELRRQANNGINREPRLFVYLGGAISESADLDTEIECRIGTAWASVRRYSF